MLVMCGNVLVNFLRMDIAVVNDVGGVSNNVIVRHRECPVVLGLLHEAHLVVHGELNWRLTHPGLLAIRISVGRRWDYERRTVERGRYHADAKSLRFGLRDEPVLELGGSLGH